VILRNILGQQQSSINLRNIMDSGKALIVDLSKGRIGEDASGLLGSLLINSLQLAAMSRADVNEEQRQDFCLYVDEFQNFATESFATILSEARKSRLSLTVANQYLAQMEESIAAAVFGNVGSLLSFPVGADDGEALAEQLGGDIEATDVMSLPKYTAYVRLLVNGLAQRPFSMETISPPTKQGAARAEIVRRQSPIDIQHP
jgi:type IV secretory pathway TraG/TraD family ATPase VirD4